MGDENGVSLNDVKCEIRSILNAEKNLTMDYFSFDKTYKNFTGYAVPYRKFGYRGCLEFLQSIPDVVTLTRNPNNSIVLHGVPNKLTMHITEMVRKSKTPKKSFNRSRVGHRSPFLYQAPVVWPQSQYYPHSQVPQYNIHNPYMCNYQNMYQPQMNYPVIMQPRYELDTGFIPQPLQPNRYHSPISNNNHIENKGKDTNKIECEPKNKFSEVVKEDEHHIQNENENEQLCNLKEDTKAGELVKKEKIHRADSSNVIMNSTNPFLNPIQCDTPSDNDISFDATTKSEKDLSDEIDTIYSFEKDVKRFNNFFYPEGVATIDDKIELNTLPDYIIENSEELVYIAEIHNPTKFWIHFARDADRIDDMENDIDTRYNDLSDSDYIMQRNHIQPNHLCMAKYSTVWHRGIITRVYEDHVKILFIDYGTISTVKIANVKYMLKEFSNDKSYAVRAYLANIAPIDLTWDRIDSMKFFNFVRDKQLHAKIISRNDDIRAVGIVLVVQDKHININKYFIDNELAVYQENNDIQLMQKPTFDELEKCLWPTLEEINRLESLDICFENILKFTELELDLPLKEIIR